MDNYKYFMLSYNIPIEIYLHIYSFFSIKELLELKVPINDIVWNNKKIDKHIRYYYYYNDNDYFYTLSIKDLIYLYYKKTYITNGIIFSQIKWLNNYNINSYIYNFTNRCKHDRLEDKYYDIIKEIREIYKIQLNELKCPDKDHIEKFENFIDTIDADNLIYLFNLYSNIGFKKYSSSSYSNHVVVFYTPEKNELIEVINLISPSFFNDNTIFDVNIEIRKIRHDSKSIIDYRKNILEAISRYCSPTL